MEDDISAARSTLAQVVDDIQDVATVWIRDEFAFFTGSATGIYTKAKMQLMGDRCPFVEVIVELPQQHSRFVATPSIQRGDRFQIFTFATPPMNCVITVDFMFLYMLKHLQLPRELLYLIGDYLLS